MVNYLKSKKGYFYKVLKNGKKIRISRNQYPKTKKTSRGIGGLAKKLSINFGITTYQTLGDCIKELIEASYSIYNSLLKRKEKITIVCGGQSPAYYSLAMMNFKIFNPELVNIVILPHSKGGVKTAKYDQYKENVKYCNRLKSNGVKLNKNVVIIDGVHSGTGILALESALKHCFRGIDVYKIAINALDGVSKIKVNEEIVLPCEPKFSDTFPRIVKSFHPREFNNREVEFITDFINLDNPIAEMIIDIAQGFPEIKVEDTEWYILNNEITPEVAELQSERERSIAERQSREPKREDGFFTPIVLLDPKRYQCPICGITTGTLAPQNPTNTSLFSHSFDCPNKFKIPKE